MILALYTLYTFISSHLFAPVYLLYRGAHWRHYLAIKRDRVSYPLASRQVNGAFTALSVPTVKCECKDHDLVFKWLISVPDSIESTLLRFNRQTVTIRYQNNSTIYMNDTQTSDRLRCYYRSWNTPCDWLDMSHVTTTIKWNTHRWFTLCSC